MSCFPCGLLARFFVLWFCFADDKQFQRFGEHERQTRSGGQSDSVASVAHLFRMRQTCARARRAARRQSHVFVCRLCARTRRSQTIDVDHQRTFCTTTHCCLRLIDIRLYETHLLVIRQRSPQRSLLHCSHRLHCVAMTFTSRCRCAFCRLALFFNCTCNMYCVVSWHVCSKTTKQLARFDRWLVSVLFIFLQRQRSFSSAQTTNVFSFAIACRCRFNQQWLLFIII